MSHRLYAQPASLAVAKSSVRQVPGRAGLTSGRLIRLPQAMLCDASTDLRTVHRAVRLSNRRSTTGSLPTQLYLPTDLTQMTAGCMHSRLAYLPSRSTIHLFSLSLLRLFALYKVPIRRCTANMADVAISLDDNCKRRIVALQVQQPDIVRRFCLSRRSTHPL